MEKICKFNNDGRCACEDCVDCGKHCGWKDHSNCDCAVFDYSKPCAHKDAHGLCQNKRAMIPGNEEPFECNSPCAAYVPGSSADVPEVVQAEVVEAAPSQPSQPPTPLNPPVFTVVVSHRTVELPAAQALSVQFARVGKTAGAAVREMVVFGAMLEKVDDGLTNRRFNNSDHPDGRGCSLKSWLEENCPEINYQTAKSYQRAAEGVRVLAKMAADVPLLPLMGRETPADETLKKVREDVLGVIANSSLNVLRRAALPMPVGNKLKGTHGLAQGRRALTAEELAAEAEKMMRENVGSIGAYLRGNWFGMLTEQSQSDFLGALRHYAETVEDLMRKAAMER